MDNVARGRSPHNLRVLGFLSASSVVIPLGLPCGLVFLVVQIQMRLYANLAEAVLIVHLLWCAWIIFGWMLTRGRRILTGLHIGSLIYAVFIELTPWPPCPLTIAENWLEMRAGLQPQTGPFLLHLLDAIVYPNLPEWPVVGSAVAICLIILAVYLRRFVRVNKMKRESVSAQNSPLYTRGVQRPLH